MDNANIPSKRLFVFAGELSGDAHGGAILQALAQITPALSVRGVGGPAMRATGMECILPMEHFQVMGFTAVIGALPRLMRAFWRIKKEILSSSPDGVLLIDYPGFNMRLAKALRKAGYRGKIIHYISPTVWAWGRHRIDQLVETLDALLTIFPFEPAVFAHTTLPVTYTGNPSFDAVRGHSYAEDWKATVGIPSGKRILAIFPGSRTKEVAHNLAKQLEAARHLVNKQSDLLIAVSLARQTLYPVVYSSLAEAGLTVGKNAFIIPKEYNYELMRDSTAAAATSGTVTLELALHRTPSVVVYHVGWLNGLFAKYYLKVQLSHYCIVNILCGETIFPELMHKAFHPHALESALAPLLENGIERQRCLSQLDHFNSVLTTSRHGQNAAEVILNVLSS